MPMVIPIVAVFASGAVGAVIAGTATFAAYASVAGAMLSTVGALSKNKDLSRIGMVLSLGGGIANIAQAGTASVGSGAAANAAASSADSAANIAIDAASNTAPVAEAAASSASNAAGSMIPEASIAQSGDDLGLFNSATEAPANAAQAAPQPYNLLERAPTLQAQAPVAQAPEVSPVGRVAPISELDKAGKALSWGDLQSYFNKAQQSVGAVGGWMKDNPALVKVGGEMLSSMYGAQAERNNMEKSLMDRARANMNNPVKMSFNRTGG